MQGTEGSTVSSDLMTSCLDSMASHCQRQLREQHGRKSTSHQPTASGRSTLHLGVRLMLPIASCVLVASTYIEFWTLEAQACPW